MDAAVNKIKDFKIDFDEKRILRLIGYRKGPRKVKEPVEGMIQEEKRKLGRLLQPEAIFAIIDYEKTNEHPIFKDAKKVALCICTIGPKLEEEVQALTKKNEMLRALILDALGSEAVEEVAVQSDKLLADKAREMGLWPSKRFSPGYGKWDIKEQRFMFSVLPAEQIGVTLKESCMMVPRKSVSFRLNFYGERILSTRSQKK